MFRFVSFSLLEDKYTDIMSHMRDAEAKLEAAEYALKGVHEEVTARELKLTTHGQVANLMQKESFKSQPILLPPDHSYTKDVEVTWRVQ